MKDFFRKFLISSAKQLTIFGEDRGVKICLLILLQKNFDPFSAKRITLNSNLKLKLKTQSKLKIKIKEIKNADVIT
ncbi:MAG: hypothetical protein ACLUR5_05610 [Eubacterium ventriosum]